MECFLPVAMGYMGMTPEAVVEKLVNTDLRETCGYVDLLQAYVNHSMHVHNTHNVKHLFL